MKRRSGLPFRARAPTHNKTPSRDARSSQLKSTRVGEWILLVGGILYLALVVAGVSWFFVLLFQGGNTDPFEVMQDRLSSLWSPTGDPVLNVVINTVVVVVGVAVGIGVLVVTVVLLLVVLVVWLVLWGLTALAQASVTGAILVVVVGVGALVLVWRRRRRR